MGRPSWGAKERRYYAVNAREFLNAPGEWFIDRAAKRLHFIPPADAPNGPFRLVYGKSALLYLNNRTNEVIRGETFAFGGDCRDVTVSNCTIRTVGRGGVHMDGGDRRTLANGNNRIVNCEIYDFGRLQRVYAPVVRMR